MKVFLGGTVNGSQWRTVVKEKLNINYFDPVVDDWNDAAYERELTERRYCDYLLYVITPKMTGFYAVAEVTDDSFKRPDRTLFCYLPIDGEDTFDSNMIAEMERLGKTVTQNGARWLKSLDEVVAFLNTTVKVSVETDKHYDAFLSFGRQGNMDFANTIANRLSEKGYEVFHDMNDIPMMVENEEAIFSNIIRSDNFIYIISPNTVRSEYCSKELEFALKFNKRIIPILYHELQHESEMLDGIVAKKPMLLAPKHNASIDPMIDEITKIIESSRAYVHKHSEYLFKARKWNAHGRSQAFLLYGKERNEAIEWLEEKNDQMKPLQLHEEFIQASKNLSVFMLPLLWLHKRTRKFTHLKWFDKVTLVISLANPIALADQLRNLLIDYSAEKTEAVSIPMWIIFLIIQLALTFVGIKNKNLGLFISMLLSVIVSASVIAIVVLERMS